MRSPGAVDFDVQRDTGEPAAEEAFRIRGIRSTMVCTNPRTGLTYTVARVRQSKDLKIVDNGDGALTLTGLNTGSLWAYGPDGQLLGRQNGLTRDGSGRHPGDTGPE